MINLKVFFIKKDLVKKDNIFVGVFLEREYKLVNRDFMS